MSISGVVETIGLSKLDFNDMTAVDYSVFRVFPNGNHKT